MLINNINKYYNIKKNTKIALYMLCTVYMPPQVLHRLCQNIFGW